MKSPQMLKPFFLLAPMDEVTETVFRQVVQMCAPADLCFTEFVNVDGLQSPGRPKLLKKLRLSMGEGPLVAQLWGLKPENFEKTAREIADGTLVREIFEIYPNYTEAEGRMQLESEQGAREEQSEPYLHTVKRAPQQGNTALAQKLDQAASSASGQDQAMHVYPNFVGIDLNMGCPAKSEVQNGACSALIKNRPLAEEIITATLRGAGDIPVSVKTRLGFNEVDLTWHEFLLGFDIHMLTVHGRTRKEMSKVPAHWDQIGEVRKIRDRVAPQTLIVGNGDVLNREQGEQLAAQYGLDGIMIGRGIFHDPFVFAKNSPWPEFTRQQKIDLFLQHVSMFKAAWGEKERRYETLKKFAKVYIHEFDGAKELREQVMATNSFEELERLDIS